MLFSYTPIKNISIFKIQNGECTLAEKYILQSMVGPSSAHGPAAALKAEKYGRKDSEQLF